MMKASFVALCLLLQVSAQDQDSPIVLRPPNNASHPVKMMIFIPGGNVPNSRYVATAESIQESLRDTVQLWVVIPAVFQRLCVISCTTPARCGGLTKDVEAALSMAEAEGWVRNTNTSDLILSGHSLGGVCANTLVQAHPDTYGSLLVFGSYVDKDGDFDLTSYPIPALTLETELDGGLARPGKASIWWRQYQQMSSSQKSNKPVLILQGLNHTNFCPGFDVPGDLPAEVPQDEATATIGLVVGAYIAIQSGLATPKNLEVIADRVLFTEKIMSPYISAEDTTVTRTSPGPNGISRMCNKLQHTVANLAAQEDARLTVQNIWFEDPKNLEHCHTNYTTNGAGVVVNTCSHTDYYRDLDNTGSIEAAKQLSCKFESTEQIAVAFNVVASAQPTCADLNREVVAYAESLALPTTLARYKAKGRPFCFLDDFHVLNDIGPLWLKADLNYTETADCMQVSSPVLLTKLTSKIYPGNFYCKILAPERVIDWMMTDSLKPFAA